MNPPHLVPIVELCGAPWTSPATRQRAREEAVRVRVDNGRVLPTGPQGSHQLHSMLGADALAIVPRGEGEMPAGAEVEIEPI